MHVQICFSDGHIKSDILKENPAFLKNDRWCDYKAFKLIGIVILLVSVAGRQSFAMS